MEKRNNCHDCLYYAKKICRPLQFLHEALRFGVCGIKFTHCGFKFTNCSIHSNVIYREPTHNFNMANILIWNYTCADVFEPQLQCGIIDLGYPSALECFVYFTMRLYPSVLCHGRSGKGGNPSVDDYRRDFASKARKASRDFV